MVFDLCSSVCVQQEGGLKLTFQKQGLPLKRPLEAEEGPQAEQQYLARLQELQSASDTVLADITTPQCSFHTGASTDHGWRGNKCRAFFVLS